MTNTWMRGYVEGACVLSVFGFEIITAPRPRYLDVDDDTWQYATIPRRCVWVSGAGTSEARTHARTHTVWASVNAAQRAHPRPRHAHTQSALHDTDRGNRMATLALR